MKKEKKYPRVRERKLPRCNLNSSTLRLLLELEEITLYLAPLVQEAFSNNNESPASGSALLRIWQNRGRSQTAQTRAAQLLREVDPSQLALLCSLPSQAPTTPYEVVTYPDWWVKASTEAFWITNEKQRASADFSSQHAGEKTHP